MFQCFKTPGMGSGIFTFLSFSLFQKRFETIENVDLDIFSPFQFVSLVMPPTSKKLRRHIGLGLSICPSVCPSVRYTCTRSRTARDRILKFGMWVEYEN